MRLGRVMFVLAAATLSSTARAQLRILPPAAGLSPQAVAESLAVLKSLEVSLKAKPGDAALWYRRGIVEWVLAQRTKGEPRIKGLDGTRLAGDAYRSLRTASDLDPANARYMLAAGTVLLHSADPGGRLAAEKYFDGAVDAARKGTDRTVHGDAALEAGRVHWRRYDAVAFRVLQTDDSTLKWLSDAAASFDGRDSIMAVWDLVETSTHSVSNVGELDLRQAEALFREAHDANPADARAFRQLAMLLAERLQWTELRILAQDRTRTVPTDGWSWMTLGLALHRSHQSQTASAMFDTALRVLDAGERRRLSAFHRLMRPRDTVRFLRTDDAAQTRHADQFWTWADPLWSREGNDARTEFLSRVTYAELRWTVEELGVRGADSDRGDIHIRYGPPRSIRTFAPTTRHSSMADRAGQGRPTQGFAQGFIEFGNTQVTTLWSTAGGPFVFRGPPTYGTARIPPEYLAEADFYINKSPFDFGNVVTGRFSLLPLRTARFRAAGDSVDLYLATRAPMETFGAVATPNSAVRSHVWLFGRDVDLRFEDSSTFGPTGNKAWTFRVPQTNWMYRIEANVPSALIAGQVTGWIEAGRDSATGFAMRGLGLSDLLLATSAQPMSALPRRWLDFTVVPLLGFVPRGGKFDVVWENYELTARDGQARYDIAVTLQRSRSAVGRVAANIVSALASVAGVDRREDRVTVKFERTAQHAMTIVDQITVELGETPPGSYTLTLTVTDRVTGRTAARTTPFTVR